MPRSSSATSSASIALRCSSGFPNRSQRRNLPSMTSFSKSAPAIFPWPTSPVNASSWACRSRSAPACWCLVPRRSCWSRGRSPGFEREREPVTVVDVGTGSGAIAIGIAAAMGPHWRGRIIAAGRLIGRPLGCLQEPRSSRFSPPHHHRPGLAVVVAAGPVDLILANLPYLRPEPTCRESIACHRTPIGARRRRGWSRPHPSASRRRTTRPRPGRSDRPGDRPQPARRSRQSDPASVPSIRHPGAPRPRRPPSPRHHSNVVRLLSAETERRRRPLTPGPRWVPLSRCPGPAAREVRAHGRPRKRELELVVRSSPQKIKLFKPPSFFKPFAEVSEHVAPPKIPRKFNPRFTTFSTFPCLPSFQFAKFANFNPAWTPDTDNTLRRRPALRRTVRPPLSPPSPTGRDREAGGGQGGEGHAGRPRRGSGGCPPLQLPCAEATRS